MTALIGREIETLEIFLWGPSMRGAVSIEEFVRASKAQGVSDAVIKADLLTDLNEGGRIFGEFRNAIRATGEGSVNRFRDLPVYSEFGTGQQMYRWVAVLSNTCPTCEDLHGNVMTWEEWETNGVPRARKTECKQHCRCVLLPAESTEMEPVKRARRK